MSASYSIGRLAAAAGVSRRTVRFYVQRNLLPPPEGLGRGAYYTDHHFALLLKIKEWQERNIPLDEIRARLSSGSAHHAQSRRTSSGRYAPKAPAPAPLADVPGSSWFRQPLVAGFELHVGSGRQPLTARQLAALATALTDILEHGGRKE